MTYEQAAQLALAEIQRAKEKWPDWPMDPVHAAGVVAEESGELLRAAMEYYYDDGPHAAMLTEAIHTAATALRFIASTGLCGYFRGDG